MNVIAVQQAPQADVQAFSDHLVRRILQHYVTFPVLVFYDAINKVRLAVTRRNERSLLEKDACEFAKKVLYVEGSPWLLVLRTARGCLRASGIMTICLSISTFWKTASSHQIFEVRNVTTADFPSATVTIGYVSEIESE